MSLCACVSPHKLPIAIPIPDKSAKTVIQAYLQSICEMLVDPLPL